MNSLSDNIIDYYYPSPSPLKELLLIHSEAVKNRALAIAEAHPEYQLDTNFIAQGAMLHDIGIIRCDAPGIHCYGTEPYICHGMEGAAMIREYFTDHSAYDDLSVDTELVERLARVCERHTGAGITVDDIRTQHLPLPERDFQPETLEEQLICYADKFYSKTRPERSKTFEEACRSLEKFGHEGVERFKAWHRLFGM